MNIPSNCGGELAVKAALVRVPEPPMERVFLPHECTVRVSHAGRDPEWDYFVARRPGAHHEQTSLWAEVKGFYGWGAFRLIVRQREQIVGGVQVLTRDIRGLARIGYVTRGPVALSNDPKLIGFLLAQLHRIAGSEGLAYLAVVLPEQGHAFEPELRRLGFRAKPNVLPPSGLMEATLVLDLTPDVDTLMSGMRKKTRQSIRRSIRKGLRVRTGVGEDVETFRRLMWALCERRGSSPTPPQKDFFEHLWATFQPSGFVRLFIAELGGCPVSAAMTFPFADTVRGWKIGWAGDHAEACPNDLLYWECIQWSKRNGYRFFDFVSIEKGVAQKLQRCEPVDWDTVGGPSQFKIRFGGSPLVVPPPYYRFYHPVLRLLGGAGGSRLIESSTGANWLGRLWNKQTQPSD